MIYTIYFRIKYDYIGGGFSFTHYSCSTYKGILQPFTFHPTMRAFYNPTHSTLLWGYSTTLHIPPCYEGILQPFPFHPMRAFYNTSHSTLLWGHFTTLYIPPCYEGILQPFPFHLTMRELLQPFSLPCYRGILQPFPLHPMRAFYNTSHSPLL